MPFVDIIGHTAAKALLRSAIMQDRVAHAYLFHGDDRIGKRLPRPTLGASAALCDIARRPGTGRLPALAEPVARWKRAPIRISWSSSRIENKPNPQIKIELIRDIEHQMIYRPLIGDRKICLIDDADR